MLNDEEIYIDPEEDEVFFGNISEKEKNIFAKFVNVAGSPRILKKEHGLDNEKRDDDTKSESSVNSESNLNNEEKITSNTSVELDHNYSTPAKQKIDKTILSTPKSVVKADKDGGFLKVLSEIALVKAEAEADDDKKEEEDKENRIIPEIKITEATPEKSKMISPSKAINSQLRRFRIMYNSPVNINSEKHTSVSEKFENCQNIKNKCLNQDEPSQKVLNESINLIDLDKPVLENSKGSDLSLLNKKEDEYEKINIICKSTEKAATSENKTMSDIMDEQSRKLEENTSKKIPENIRFSKDARKIVEVLKKSVTDDTLNFTIPEIDVDNVENSFLSPEPVTGLDVTVVANKIPDAVKSETPRQVSKLVENKPTRVVKTVEKERQKMTPIVSQSKMDQLKYFSDRRIYNQTGSVGKGCVKKLEMEDKLGHEDKKNFKGASGASASSRIPVFGVKSSRLPVNNKITPMKTPTGSSCKNPKFKNIESPINAYIHNKPTSLVVNIKPEAKKGGLTLSKIQPPSSKPQALKPQNPVTGVQLPFVQYKSATPLKVEKKPESRLPRLAPNVQKLLGTHSPKVIKHVGRFCMNTPKRGASTNDTTLVADVNEVSLVVCKTAQKSNAK